MPRVSVAEVQRWLDPTILSLAEDDELGEQDMFGEAVVGKLGARFDTSTWVDATTTPLLIRTCIAVLVASWRYNILFSKTGTGELSPYSQHLENLVWGEYGIVECLLMGTLHIPGIEDSPSVVGTLTGDFGEEPSRFMIGQSF